MIDDVLGSQDLLRFRDAYDPVQMASVLGTFFAEAHPASLPYVAAIGSVFYAAPDGEPAPRERLAAVDRERCLVALLAARGSTVGLAIHIYLALMQGVSAGEVADILFLTGVYTGIDNFAEALKVEIAVLEQMRLLVARGETTPGAVVATLEATFRR